MKLKRKATQRASKRDKERIVEVLNILEREGLSARLDIRKLRGYQRHFRVRLGAFRLRFELSSESNDCGLFDFATRKSILIVHVHEFLEDTGNCGFERFVDVVCGLFSFGGDELWDDDQGLM